MTCRRGLSTEAFGWEDGDVRMGMGARGWEHGDGRAGMGQWGWEHGDGRRVELENVDGSMMK